MMKILFLLAVLVAVSFAAPNFPTTYEANYNYEITTSSADHPKADGTGKIAEDNTNQKKLNCGTVSGESITVCRLTDYPAKSLYIYGKDPNSGKVTNCTKKALPANDSTYRDDWVWVPESKSMGSTSFGYCGKSAGTWELKFESKIDLRVGVSDSNPNQPAETDYKLTNSSGFIEKVSCFTSFSTNVDPSMFTPPAACNSMFTPRYKKDDPFFLFDGLF